VRRLFVLAVLVALALPAAARADELPTKLWAEYPLEQEFERSSTPVLGPLLPRDDSAADPGSEPTSTWAIWGAAMSACLVALLMASRLLRPVPNTRERDRETPTRFRQPGLGPRSAESGVMAQYAPLPPPALLDVRDEHWRSIVMRTGLLRGRYVVLEGEPLDDQRAIAASRSFWSIGGARTRMAEDAWDDLLNELRTAGWEPDPNWHSDFYVLLQPVAPEPTASIVPTLGAYGRTADDSDDD
jgi:hypothetical protein